MAYLSSELSQPKMAKPIILLAFANDQPDQEGYLRNLSREVLFCASSSCPNRSRNSGRYRNHIGSRRPHCYQLKQESLEIRAEPDFLYSAAYLPGLQVINSQTVIGARQQQLPLGINGDVLHPHCYRNTLLVIRGGIPNPQLRAAWRQTVLGRMFYFASNQSVEPWDILYPSGIAHV